MYRVDGKIMVQLIKVFLGTKNEEKMWYIIFSSKVLFSRKSNLKFATFVSVYFFTSATGYILLVDVHVTVRIKGN